MRESLDNMKSLVDMVNMYNLKHWNFLKMFENIRTKETLEYSVLGSHGEKLEEV